MTRAPGHPPFPPHPRFRPCTQPLSDLVLPPRCHGDRLSLGASSYGLVKRRHPHTSLSALPPARPDLSDCSFVAGFGREEELWTNPEWQVGILTRWPGEGGFAFTCSFSGAVQTHTLAWIRSSNKRRSKRRSSVTRGTERCLAFSLAASTELRTEPIPAGQPRRAQCVGDAPSWSSELPRMWN